MLLLVPVLGLLPGPLHFLPAPPRHFLRPGSRCAAPRSELGFQVDPSATASSVLVLSSFAALQLKINQAQGYREARDAALEAFRSAQVRQLDGKLAGEEVERIANAARAAVEEYQAARRVVALFGAELRIPDPTATKAQVVLRDLYPKERLQRQAETRADSAGSLSQANGDGLDPLRERLGLLRPRGGDGGGAVGGGEGAPQGSVLPTGSNRVTLKDAAIGLALLLQVGWLLLSLTDPMGPPGPVLEAVLSAGGEVVDARGTAVSKSEMSKMARRAAESDEYRAMLQEAVDKGEAPACPESGCGGRYIPRMPSSPSGPDDAVRMSD